MTRGRFITLEGGEGVGKSTQIRALAAALAARDIDVVTTREPGGSGGAEAIRTLLMEGSDDRWDARSEVLLFAAARADHVARTIRPALARGAWVLCDRFTDSSYAYQGGGRGLDAALIATLERSVVGIEPGLTLLLDVAVADGRARMRGRESQADRIEREHDAFFERVRAAFLARAREHPGRFRVLDASRPADAVAADALDRLRAYRTTLA